MKSTGEVMGLDCSFARAFAKSQLGAGLRLPVAGTVFVSVKDKDKAAMIEPCRKLAALGFRLLATGGHGRISRGPGHGRGAHQQGP